MDKRRMCPNCRAFITTDDKVCPYCGLKMGPKAVDVLARSTSGIAPDHFATYALLLVNAGIYVAMLVRTGQITGTGFDFGATDNVTAVAFGAMFAPWIHAQWWRLITAGFLHGSLLHILGNSWVLFNLGPQVDEAYGTRRFLVIYLASGFTGFLASYLYGTQLTLGASASGCGMFGAMIALGIREKSSYGRAILSNYVTWVVIILIQGFILPFVDNAAHIGGLAGGFGVAYLAGGPSYSEAKETFWRLAAGVALALTAYAFFEMFMQLKSTT